MSDLQILTLAIIQGITEFLPISSSGHLLLTSKIFGWVDQGLAMDIAVHVGTLGAVIVYFFDDVMTGLKGGYGLLLGRRDKSTAFAWNIVLATIPVVIAGYFLKDYLATEFRNDNIVTVIAWTSIIFGSLLWLIDKSTPTVVRVEHISKGQALFLGVLQVLALIPGVSRSGICMTAGRLLGMERTESARISMIMGMPVLFAAGTLVGIELYKTGNIILTAQFGLAALLSFCAGIFAIRVMMLWISKSDMTIFAVYRIAFGIGLLYWIDYY